MTSAIRPVRTFADAGELGRALAAELADEIAAKTAQGARFLLGCPGGRTPVTTYRALADEAAARSLDLSNVVIVMMDDYVERAGDGWAHIPADAHNSCRRFAREEIQHVLGAALAPEHRIADENVWFPDPAAPEEYDARIAEAGGIDFFLLASGAGDGHVAFNPPGSPATSRTRVVELAEQTRRDNLATFPDYPSLDAVPTHGVTVGIATIAEFSHRAAMILVGADKREAFARLTTGDEYDAEWPATVYRLIEGAALYADAAAAS